MRGPVYVRELPVTEINRIIEINRAEEILEAYQCVKGKLLLASQREQVSGFTEHEWHDLYKRQIELLENGTYTLKIDLVAE